MIYVWYVQENKLMWVIPMPLKAIPSWLRMKIFASNAKQEEELNVFYMAE